MKAMRFPLRPLALLLLLPAVAAAVSYSTIAAHTRPEGMNNFEIVTHDPDGAGIWPETYVSEGVDWNVEFVDGGAGVTTIRFYGTNTVPSYTGVNFGIETGDQGFFVTDVYWSFDEERFPLAEVSPEFYVTPEENVRVVINNLNAERWIQLNAARWKVATTLVPLEQLNYDDHPPETFEDAGVAPVDIPPGDGSEFTFNLNRGEYVILNTLSTWVDRDGHEYDWPITSYWQIHVDEMTPAGEETWSGLKLSYE